MRGFFIYNVEMKKTSDAKLIKEALERSVDTIYPSRQELEKALANGKKLRIYLGIDPTGPHLHFGHATNLLVLKRFQELGHEIILLIGDFTARIGDPTDKLAPRQPLTAKQVAENFKTFKKQVSKFIKFTGPNKAKIMFNSKWLGKMTFSDVIKLSQHITVQQMIQRDMFQERLKANKPIGANEFFYPLMQGYDSVVMDVDMEIGGTDQTFNMLVGRDLLKIYKNKEKFVLTTKLLINPKTGRKLMNKSEGGLINLDDKPNDIFGKVMAIDDEAMFSLAEYSTEMPMEEIDKLKSGIAADKIGPRDAKLRVAFAAVELIYGKSAAEKAEEEFVRVVSKKETPTKIKSLKLKVKSLNLVDLLVVTKLASSKSEARRLIEQGGVKIDGEKQTNLNKSVPLNKEILLQVGKMRYLKIQGF
jgi:tyrosyl-tRNA synthetase